MPTGIPPNVLLITSDQQHWNTIGAFNSEIHTPHLDRLVREGTTFDRAYCPDPTCTPTRASIITGKYPSQHGAWSLGTKLPEDQPTVGAMLREAGYATGLVGKAHFQPLASSNEYESIEAYPVLHDLDFWRDFTGPYYGFDHVELIRNHTSEAHAGQHYALWLEQQGCTQWRDYFQPPTGTLPPDTRHTWPLPERFHYNHWITERSSRLMRSAAERSQPFFLWASFPDPHPPYLVPEPWDRMYEPDRLTIPDATRGEHDANPPHFGLTQQADPDFSPWQESGHRVQGLHSHRVSPAERRRLVATYYAMVSFLDAAVGRLLTQLDDLGLTENTLVVFTTDHGHLFGQHGLQAKGPFLYEDLIRMPFLVRWPGRVPEDAVSSAIQSHVDLAPTFLTCAGRPVPQTMTGVSQYDVWTGATSHARDHAVCEFHHEPTTLNLRSYIDERYKLTVYQGREYGELYDLVADPGEINNLWNQPAHAGLRERLLLRLLWAELGKEPMWMPRVSLA